MTFEDLASWQEARLLAKQIYQLARQRPLCRDYVATDQLRRAGISAMTNVAEGFERTHEAEKLQFWNVAHASAGEVRSLTYLLEDNQLAPGSEVVELRAQAVKVGALIRGLIRSFRKRA